MRLHDRLRAARPLWNFGPLRENGARSEQPISRRDAALTGDERLRAGEAVGPTRLEERQHVAEERAAGDAAMPVHVGHVYAPRGRRPDGPSAGGELQRVVEQAPRPPARRKDPAGSPAEAARCSVGER